MKTWRKKQKRKAILGHGERRERLSVSLTKIRVHLPFWFYQSKKQKKEDDTDFSVKNEKSPFCQQTTPSMGSILSLIFFR